MIFRKIRDVQPGQTVRTKGFEPSDELVQMILEMVAADPEVQKRAFLVSMDLTINMDCIIDEE